MAWGPLGWRPVFFAEIERFACAVLKHHHAAVPNRGDISKFKEWPDANFDVLAGGTPCQSFSVAGLRRGMDDARGGLTRVYLAIARRYRPRWLVWENVPGVLSIDEGRAFGAFIGGLAELGYGFAWRVLDARYFGLAQRRARVFLVAHLGDWRRAAAVLFESESLRGDPPPGRAAWQGIAGTITRRALDGSSPCGGDGREGLMVAGTLQASHDRIRSDESLELVAGTLGVHHGNPQLDQPMVPMIANPLTARMAKGVNTTMDEGQTMIQVAFKPSHYTRGKDGAPSELAPPLSADADRGDQDTVIAFDCKRNASDSATEGLAPTLRAMNADDSGDNAGGQLAVAFDTTQITSPDNYSVPQPGDPCHPLAAGAHPPAVATTTMVRRLTPRECERLLGFPDDYTRIPYRGAPAKDGPRYKALGNSIAVPVLAWIGARMAAVDEL